MAIKNVYLKKKIAGTVYDIYPRSSADMIEYDGSTVAAKLASLATGVGDVYTKSEADDKLTELYNKIMGFTDADKTINDAYDTLKEVAAWLDENDDVSTLISDLAAVVGDADSGLVKDVNALKTAVGDSNSGLVKDVAALQAVGATKVEASATNGNIKINGTEVTVYDDSAVAATKVTEDDDHNFVTAEEKATIKEYIQVVEADTDVTDDGVLYIVEVADESAS
jgi:hypothetical protein